MKILFLIFAVAGLLHSGSLQTTTLSPPPTYKLRVCRGVADVVLVLDRSGSVGDKDYPYLIGFALHLARTFEISPDKVRLGVASYADTAKREIQLNTCCYDKFKNSTDMMNRGKEDLTNIYAGLLVAESMLEDKVNGARDGAVKLIIITNDNNANRGEPPIPTAQRLAKKGINILSLGIEADVKPPTKNFETKSLASRPDLYQWVPKYTTLAEEEFLQKVTESVCDVVTVREPVVGDTSKSIYEDTVIGTHIHTIPALIEEFNIPKYQLIPQDNLPFRVEPNGDIYTTGKLDREVIPQYEFFVYVTDVNFPGFQKKIKVTVIILDVNDNAPIPEKLVYNVEVFEDIQFNPPTTLLTVFATDADEGTNSEIRYMLSATGNEEGRFQLIESTGAFQVKAELDREKTDSYTLKAYAEDKGTPKQRSVDITIYVKVKDRNDNPPKFENAEIYLEYHEDHPLGQLYQLVAEDLDLGLNKEVFYKFHSTEGGNEDNKFSLNEDNGYLNLVESLNFEDKSKYTLKVVASDKGTPSLSSTITIHITVLNDDEPLTVDGPHVVFIPEDHGKVKAVAKVTAIDPDKEIITYKILEDSPFAVDGEGVVRVVGTIDRESAIFVYHLTVTASAGKHTVESKVTITVTDVNDNVPIFGETEYFGNIDENAAKGTAVQNTKSVSATDKDATEPNNKFDFSIQSGNIDNAFVIDAATGIVSVNNPSVINFESAVQIYILTIKVGDRGYPQLSSTVSYTIRINNINDNPPIPKQNSYEKEIYENLGVGENVVIIEATDADNEILKYSIPTGLPFTIDSMSGQITVSSKLDAESQTLYNFKAIANDGKHDVEIAVKITVMDVNDVVPTFEPAGPLTITVNEDKEIGYVITKLIASDGDLTTPNNLFEMMIEQGNDDKKFSLQQDGTLKLDGILNFKEKETYTLYIKVVDKGVRPGPLSSVIKIIINVGDVNIHAPVFIQTPYSAEIPENQPNPFVFKVLANDADLPHDILTFSIINDVPFEINSQTGVITGKGVFDSERQHMYQIQVRVTDNAGHFAETTINVLVLDENDETPYFLSGKSELLDVSENSAVGHVIETYLAKDKDRTSPNNLVMYTIVGDGNVGNAFKIDQNTGVLSINTPLDYETRTKYTIVIRAQDKGSPSLYMDLTVTIFLKNENEFPPVFQQSTYEAYVAEDKPNGYRVLTVKSSDNDADSVVAYSIPAGLPFAIDNNGDITLKSLNPPELPLDYEKQKMYTFLVFASDGLGKTAEVNVTIYVTDVNDNAPEFVKNYVEYIPENFEVGKIVITVEATDKDSGNNKELMYTFEGGDKDTFSIDMTTGQIKLLKNLNFEVKNLYELQLKAEDKGNPSKSTTTTVIIHVTDVNERPVFEIRKDEVSIPENSQVGKEIRLVSCVDPDSGDNGKVMYTIVSGNNDGKFELDMNTGKLTLKNTVDFEVQNKYVLVIRGTDKGQPALNTEGNDLELTILVEDVNEKPYFNPSTETKTIPETKPVGEMVTTVTAMDPDKGVGGMVMYQIISGNGKEDFKIDENTGLVSVAKELDFNRQNQYDLKIRATDKGTPSQNSGPDDMTLIVIVTDVNNNPPIFNPEVYGSAITESTEVGHKVVRVLATDKDSGLNGMIVYRIIGGNDDGTFNIDEVTGDIILNKKADFEQLSKYTLTVRAFDKGNPSLHSNPDAHVYINITNINEFAPEITNLPYILEVNEGKSSIEIYKVIATDKDGDIITYTIQTDGPFVIDSQTGIVSLTEVLDRETKSSYRIIVTASDGVLQDQNTLDIVVKDINDNKPIFVKKLYEEFLSENTPKGVEFLKVEATDADKDDNAKVMYMIISGNEEKKFEINQNTGVISLIDGLDYEITKQYKLTVRASDKGTPQLTSEPDDCQVIINVLDENDNKPVFKPEPPIDIREDALPYVVIQVTATDADSGDNGLVMYEIIDGNQAGKFVIDMNSGKISLVGKLDYEDVKQYTLTIRATDKGKPSKSSAPNDLTLIINVLDVNDNVPQFTKKEYQVSIPEDTVVGATVLTVFANDGDSGLNGQVMFSLKAGHDGKFRVDENTGAVVLLSGLDVLVQKVYTFTVLATDKGQPSLVGEAVVRIDVTDVNNHPPVFEPVKYEKEFSENVEKDTIVTQVKATDLDEGVNGEIMYEITEGNEESKFTIDMNSGIIIFKDTVDFEKTKKYTLTVRATDKGFPSQHSNPDAMVTIVIKDENDNSPVFDKPSYTKTIPEDTVAGSSVLTVSAVDADSGDNARVMYEIITPGVDKFTIDMSTGQIITAGKFDVTVQDKYVFLVKATDKGTPSKSSESTVTIFISDVNMPPKIFPGGPFEIFDNKAIGEEVFVVKADDPDIGDNGKIMATLTGGDGLFEIDMNTRKVTVSKDLATIEQKTVKLTITVSDKGNPSLSAVEDFYVTIKPSNHPPVITPVNPVTIREDINKGEIIAKVEANDPDDGDNGKLMYEIVGGNDGNVFKIDMSTGTITVEGVLNFDVKNKYELIVKVSDKGKPSLSVTTSIGVMVTKSTIPLFLNTPYTKCVDENVKPGDTIFTASAIDADGDSLKFFINIPSANVPFVINENTGQISATQVFDAEVTQEFNFVIGVTDGKHRVTVNINICINNVNDVPPIVSIPGAMEVCEDKKPGDLVLQIVAKDGDIVQTPLSYKILPTDVPFAIDNTGAITLSSPIDFETMTSFLFSVVVSDGKLETTVKVTINVCNVNDNAPVFTNVPHDSCIDENLGAGHKIFTAAATDADGDTLTFFIPEEYKDFPFSIDVNTGMLTTTAPLDAEKVQKYEFAVGVTDGKYRVTGKVTVCVNNVNDVPPVVTIPGAIEVCEDKKSGDLLLQIVAKDGDIVQTPLSYKILPTDVPFAIDNTGAITLSSPIDFETMTSFVFSVVVSDGKLETTVKVTINVCNVNDNAPVFTNVPHDSCIDENLGAGHKIFTAAATDADGDTLTFFIPEEYKDFPFSIDVNTGMLTTTAPLDAEKVQKYEFAVGVTDGKYRVTGKVTVCVNNVNDVPPVVTIPGAIEVCEDKKPGHLVLQIVAKDGDIVQTPLSYKILPTDVPFAIDNTGAITLSESIDFEKIKVYTFKVIVSDGLLETSIDLTVRVCDVVDSPPRFTNVPHESCVLENSDIGTVIFTASATDVEINNKLSFFIADISKDAPFAIDENTGVVTTTAVFDAEKVQKFEFTIGVTDGASKVFGKVTVCVDNINDIPPSVNVPNDAEVCENSDGGTFVLQIAAVDPDIVKLPLTYQLLVKDAVPFLIDGNGKITVNGNLDFETRSSYQFAVRVSDGTLFSDVTVKISICDLNEYKPVFVPDQYEAKINDGSEVGTSVITVTATDKDDGTNGMIIYNIVGGNDDNTFKIDQTTGKITLNSKVDASKQTMYTLTISATDKGTRPSSMTSSPNAIVKVMIVKVIEACECKLPEESYPCIKWTKYEIIRNFEGKCYLDKLGLAIEHIKSKITNVTNLIEQFTTCKSNLKQDISSHQSSIPYATLFERYDQCVTNVECKLTLWKMQLQQKLSDLEKEQLLEKEGWGTFNLPGGDYLEAFLNFIQKSKSSRV